MTNNFSPILIAKPRGVSLYDPQWDYAKERAQELSKQSGKPVSASEFIQTLIDADKKKHITSKDLNT